MNFDQRKLPLDAVAKLRPCPINSVQAYALMMAPVYILMRMNAKLVAVKGPMDFFTESELEKLKSLETFFLWPSVDTALIFRNAARRMRAVLSWNPVGKAAGDEGGKIQYVASSLPPAPYELSDAALRILGPLLDKNIKIEPFFVAVFVNELCSLISSSVLLASREKGVEHFEYSALLSGVVVFLAMIAGQTELSYLDTLHERTFIQLNDPQATPLQGDEFELFQLARKVFPTPETRELKMEFFEKRADRLSQRLATRLARIRQDLKPAHGWNPTIYGEKGFLLNV